MLKNKQWLLFNVDAENNAQDLNQESLTDQDENLDKSTEEPATYTQKDIDKIISKRLKEERKKFSDYDAVKQENETLKNRLKEIEEKEEDLQDSFKSTIYSYELKEVSRSLGLDVELAGKLIEQNKVQFEDNKPVNLKALLEGVIEKHPNLVRKQSPNVSPPGKENEQPKQQLLTNRASSFFSGGGIVIN